MLVFRLHEGARLFHFLLPVVVGGFGALVVAAESGGVVARVLSLSPVVALGRISYSLYLWHVPILFALGPKIGSALSVVVSVVVAAISTRYVEARFRRRRAVRFEPVASPA